MRTLVTAVALVACTPNERVPAHAPAGSAEASRPVDRAGDATPLPADRATSPTDREHAMSVADRLRTPAIDVKSLLQLRELAEADIASALGPPEHAVAYQKLRPVDCYGRAGAARASFFYQNATLVMVYTSSAEYLARLSRAAIENELGSPEATLRSRQGKTANQYVYPQRGFAYSEDGGEIGFVEVFPPMTLDAYRAKIYAEPGAFIR
jgi:hypothetical protein